MTKAELIKLIVAQEGFDESDAKWLEAHGETELGKFAALCKPAAPAAAAEGATPPATSAPAAAATPPAVTAQTADTAAPPKLSEEEWLEQAPPKIREVVVKARAEQDAKEADLRKAIITNTGGLYTDDELKELESEKLEKLAAATKPKPDQSARGLSSHDAGGGKPNGAHASMPGIKIGA